jgi:hypothetical protein
MRTLFVSSAKITSLLVLSTTLIVCPPAQSQEQSGSVTAGTRPLITEAIDESRLTTLKGNTHPLARAEFDLGTADGSLPMKRMLLVLKRSDEQESVLRKLLDDQQDKHSPSYHKWLTPETFGQQFGPTDADMQTITSWLQSHGFEVGSTKGRTVLEFSGTAAQVQEAFHTTIHKYLVNEKQHWANSTDPQIPSALTEAVSGVKTLHSFFKKPTVHLSQEHFSAKLVGKSHPEFTGTTGQHALTPDDYRTIYNGISALSNGSTGLGVTIAVVGRNDLYQQGQDVADFHQVLGVDGGAPNILVNGPDPGDAGGSEEAEATLDSSWAAALAPNANVDFVVSGSTNTTDGIDLSELYIIENNLGAIMTESFSSCEANTTSSDAQGTSLLAEQAAAQGITYIVSAGDTGAEGCDNLGETTAVGGISVNVLASTPFTVAVGGTMFNEHGQDASYWGANNSAAGSALSYIPENVWNETCAIQCQPGQPPLAAGAGGASIYFSKPSWQSGVTGTSNDTARDVPDVSLSAAAHDPYLLCLDGSCVPNSQGEIYFAAVSGTSAAAPSFAGAMALVDGPNIRQGAANYILYRLASVQQGAATACNASNTSTLPNSACTFNDVTSGNNSVPGETSYPNGLYSAATGYDLASGLGSVNVGNLVSNWNTVTFNPTTTTFDLNGNTTAITITHGQPVTVTAGVSPNSGSTTPSGDVVLYTASTLAPSTLDLFHLSAGQASGSTSSLPGSTVPYNVWAHYGGDSTYAPSDSNQISVAVNPEASTTALSLQVTDMNGNPLTGPFPFGSLVFVRADVAGKSGHGVPTGSVTFTDTLGPIPSLNPQVSPPVQVSASPSLNSQGNTSIADGIVSFDAGNHSISASYSGDPSFSTSNSTAPVTFTIQPGFIAVSGPNAVTISSPGEAGTTTMGIIASGSFTSKITFTCSGLPAEATCASTSVTGQGPTAIVLANIVVSTTAPHTVAMHSNGRRYYFAALLGMGLPFGILFVVVPRRRWNGLLALMLLAIVVTVPACGGGGGGGGGSSQQHQDPGTPAGTYTITVTATAGSITQQGAFTLLLQ